MAKISRPILYIAIVGAIAYTAVILTEPDTPARKRAARSTKTAVVEAGGFTKEDYTAHFARYRAQGRNAFQPLIVPHKASDKAKQAAPKKTPLVNGGIALNGKDGTWTLTGISALDGVQSALLENSATKEIQFVKVGDVWNGLRVASIGSDAVVFVNAQGQQARLTFPEIAPTPAPGTGAAAPNPAVPGASAPPGGIPTAPPPRAQRQGGPR
ncbi:MAG TPA: hypothetical protein VFB38_26515 [Chthonomonadaceae bacterium]|nr:hypothetical protein [Chthonomonadaceae bacterium]